MQGGMKKRRRTIEAAGCALVVVALAAPAASASPLLSGYGGPGQGNQAILGSALLNGGGTGGGSSGGSGSAQRSGSGSLAVASQPASSSRPTISGQRPRHGAPASSSRQQGAAGGPAQSALPPSLAYDRAERTGSSSPSGSGTLGLSAADFLYGALVLVGLLLAGVVTRRLTRTTPAKGHG